MVFTWKTRNIKVDRTRYPKILVGLICSLFLFPQFSEAATFGYTSIGASNGGIGSNTAFGLLETAPNTGTVSSIRYFAAIGSGSGNFKGIIFSYATPDLTLLSNGIGTAAAYGTTFAWQTSTFSSPPSITATQDLGIGVVHDNGGTTIKYDSLTGAAFFDSTYSYASPVDATREASNQNLRWSMYAIYSTTEPGTYTDIFPTPGYASWTAPTGVTSADVACWGAGGGGGDGSGAGAGGGGGGAFASSTVAVTPSTQYTLFIGAGGSRGTATGGPGFDGATSTFATTTVVADGGKGGRGGGGGDPGGGIRGLASLSTGTITFDGGGGGIGRNLNDTGGGGGGGAGPHGAGGNGADGNATAGHGGGGGGGNGGSNSTSSTGGASTNGGAGGTGDSNGATAPAGGVGGANSNGGGGGGGGDDGDEGGDGGAVGGGGGGGENNSAVNSGNGAAGQCTITYTISGGGGGGGSSPSVYNTVIWLD